MGLLTLVAAHGVTMTSCARATTREAAVAALAELVGDRASARGAILRGWRELMEAGRGRRVAGHRHRRRARARRAGSRSTSGASPPSRSRPRLQRFERALPETDAQLARIQPQIAEREGDEHQYRILEAHRLMLSDVHLVERARNADPRRQDRRRVGGAPGAGPDPGGLRAHRGSRTSAIARATSPWSASACCATWWASAIRRRPRRRPRGASPSRTICRPPTPPSWGAPRRPGSAPRGAAAPRTPRSWRARWGCRYVVGVEG